MDVRAIYGSSAKPKGAMERVRELELEGKQRCCFFRTDGPTLQDKFRKVWDVVQVVLLVYVAIMVPYRTGFQIDIATLSTAFWFEVGVDIYLMFDILINFRSVAVLRVANHGHMIRPLTKMLPPGRPTALRKGTWLCNQV